MAYAAATNGDKVGGAASRETPFAQIAQDDHEAPVWSLAFAGSRRLVSSTSSELRVKDLATGEVVRLLDYRESFGLTPAFSPDGRTLAIGANRPEVRLWNVETWIEQEPLSLGTKAARYVVFSPNGAMLAVATWSSHKVTLYDWRDARPIAVLDGHAGEVNILAFSPDGLKLVAADSASQVCIRDLASRRAQARWRAHAAGIWRSRTHRTAGDSRPRATSTRQSGSGIRQAESRGEFSKVEPPASLASPSRPTGPGSLNRGRTALLRCGIWHRHGRPER